MFNNIPKVSNLGPAISQTRHVVDHEVFEKYMGCPITTRLITRITEGSFRRTCDAFQKRVNEEEGKKKNTSGYYFTRINTVCKTCKIGKAVREDKPILQYPPRIEIIEFEHNGMTSPLNRFVKKEPELKKPKVRSTKYKKMTPDLVRILRVERSKGMRVVDLVKQYGVNPHSIQDILSGRTWKNV